jgi:hypothetical protein
LQGIYSFANLTPLQRPAEFGNRATITAEEAAEYEAQWNLAGAGYVQLGSSCPYIVASRRTQRFKGSSASSSLKR